MRRTDSLSTYIDLFVGRRDDYAMQCSSGHYRRVGKPLLPQDVSDHLLGVRTYGTYVMNSAGRCRFAVIDDDSLDGLARLWTIQDQLATEGITSSVEQSRRGGHLWVFLAQPTLASHLRAWLLPFCPADLEFYPKQDEGKGYGSLIRLPLGIHRKSGQRYHFVQRGPGGQLLTLTATDEDREAWFTSIQRLEAPQHVQPPARAAPRKTLTHPLFSSSASQDETAPRSIRQWNAEQDPYDLIGRYVKLDDKGVGCCPFGDHHRGGKDTQASFKVYEPGVEGGYCWYCYTWQRGGSVFDFLRYYYGLDARTLWQRLQTDGVI